MLWRCRAICTRTASGTSARAGRARSATPAAGTNGPLTGSAARRFQAICRALNRCDDEQLEQRLIESLARQVIEGALTGDPRLLLQIVERILGPLEYADSRRHRLNWTRRQTAAAG